MKKVKLMLILAIVAGLSGFILSFVNTQTAPVIAQKEIETEKEIYASFFPTMDSYEKTELDSNGINYKVEIFDQNKTSIGWVYSATGRNGYGDITALIGIDEADNIVGLQYSVFNQTPGFGDRLQEPEYLDQFNMLPASEPQIDGVSGATYSSNLVNDLVVEMTTYHEENNA